MKAYILRWREVGIVALVLFAINIAGRLIADQIKAANPQVKLDREALAGFITLAVIALVFFGLTLYWGRLRTMWKVTTELAFAGGLACLLSIFLGPLTVGNGPFTNGAGDFFAQIWWWIGLALVGIFLGYVALISFTADYKSKQLKNYVERAKAQPKRV